MPVMIATPAPVVYEVLDQSNLDECVGIMSEIFSKGEPLTRLLGISPVEFEYFAEIFARKAQNEGLAIFAKENATGNMLGFCLSEDLLSEPPSGFENITPKFEPIMALVQQLDAWFTDRFTVSSGDYLHIFMTGTSRRCRQRDVSLGVVAESLRLAKERGFIGALGESTTTLAFRAAARNEFRQQFAISYADFCHRGEAVFAEMGPRAKCRLMVKWFG